MAFEKVIRTHSGSNGSKEPFITVTRENGKAKNISITLPRHSLTEKLLDSERVDVFLGTGEDNGKIQIRPGSESGSGVHLRERKGTTPKDGLPSAFQATLPLGTFRSVVGNEDRIKTKVISKPNNKDGYITLLMPSLIGLDGPEFEDQADDEANEAEPEAT